MSDAHDRSAETGYVEHATGKGMRINFFDGFEGDPTLDAPLVVNKLPYEINPYSPTPGDPFNLQTSEGIDYFNGAKKFMLDRFRQRVKNTNLGEKSQKLVESEIEEFHMRRCTKSAEGLNRLRFAVAEDPKKWTDELRGTAIRYRTGIPSFFDTLNLLSTYPQMEAVGGMQYTNPFNVMAVKKAATINFQRIIKELDDHGIRYRILNEQPDVRPGEHAVKGTHQTYDSLALALDAARHHQEVKKQSPLLIVKRPLIEIEYNDVVMQVMESTNPFVAPLYPEFHGVKENKVTLPGLDRVVNLQNISYGTYVRAIPHSTEHGPSLSEEFEGMLFVSGSLAKEIKRKS
ncbi:MAG: hypothetical protein WAV04_02675 [Candidatus Microsaccharimonas sp.]